VTELIGKCCYISDYAQFLVACKDDVKSGNQIFHHQKTSIFQAVSHIVKDPVIAKEMAILVIENRADLVNTKQGQAELAELCVVNQTQATKFQVSVGQELPKPWAAGGPLYHAETPRVEAPRGSLAALLMA